MGLTIDLHHTKAQFGDEGIVELAKRSMKINYEQHYNLEVSHM